MCRSLVRRRRGTLRALSSGACCIGGERGGGRRRAGLQQAGKRMLRASSDGRARGIGVDAVVGQAVASPRRLAPGDGPRRSCRPVRRYERRVSRRSQCDRIYCMPACSRLLTLPSCVRRCCSGSSYVLVDWWVLSAGGKEPRGALDFPANAMALSELDEPPSTATAESQTSDSITRDFLQRARVML